MSGDSRPPETGTDSGTVGRRSFLQVGRFGYSTIAEAWDAASDGDTILVTGTYDAQEAGEEFPVTLDYREKEVTLPGGHPAGSRSTSSRIWMASGKGRSASHSSTVRPGGVAVTGSVPRDRPTLTARPT